MKKVLITFLFMLGLMIPGAYGRTSKSIIQDYNSSAGVNVTSNALDVNVVDGTALEVTINEHTASSAVAIATVVLDDSPTTATSTVVSGGNNASVMWFIYLDETDSGDDTSAAITLDYSQDNSTWLTGMPFYRGSDGTIVVTYATGAGASTDENLVIWLPEAVRAVPYVRMVVTATGSAAGGDDQVEVTAYVATQK